MVCGPDHFMVSFNERSLEEAEQDLLMYRIQLRCSTVGLQWSVTAEQNPPSDRNSHPTPPPPGIDTGGGEDKVESWMKH